MLIKKGSDMLIKKGSETVMDIAWCSRLPTSFSSRAHNYCELRASLKKALLSTCALPC